MRQHSPAVALAAGKGSGDTYRYRAVPFFFLSKTLVLSKHFILSRNTLFRLFFSSPPTTCLFSFSFSLVTHFSHILLAAVCRNRIPHDRLTAVRFHPVLTKADTSLWTHTHEAVLSAAAWRNSRTAHLVSPAAFQKPIFSSYERSFCFFSQYSVFDFAIVLSCEQPPRPSL